MVSPSKKRQIKGRVTTGHKIDRKGEKASSKLPYKPLSSKKFYLDIKGHKSKAAITADIHNLGGIVEEFLSREVSYVISTRGQQPAGGSSSEQQPSPSGALTPHQPLSSLPSTSHDSPLNLDSPREDSGKRRVRTRAEVLLERVCVRRQGTSDVLENARLWNVPVWPLTKLVNWLTVLKESGRYKPPKTNGALASKNSLSSSPKATRLQAPFIKTEAFTRQYKPLYKELPSWPELNLFNPCGVSLFADPKQARARQWPKSSASAVRNDHKDRRVRERIRGTKAKESGYCELCTTTYTNLTLHLKSDSHTAFVRNDKNYLYLDELISGEKQNCLVSGVSAHQPGTHDIYFIHSPLSLLLLFSS
ncbi:Protein DBF4 B [Chionoecetes opilio]|uniref:Protein DBF4 B n=1 Tax=Chionoecetes opilio TaxID=41210 RepID=A0A8J4XXT1_CHIOP|nr:Protein DBF4 B [Chionoecetes opilio]